MNLQSFSLNLAKERIQKWIGRSRTLSTRELSSKLGLNQGETRRLMGAARLRPDRQRRWVTAEVIEVLEDALDGSFVYDPLKEQWNEWASTYYLGALDLFINDPQDVFIKAAKRLDGTVMWAVLTPETNGWCLTKDLEWVYEPKPSDRTNEYFLNTRYNSKGEALSMLNRYKEEKERALLYY